MFLGRYRVTEKADAFWSRGEGKDYIGPVLTDPTWKDLMVEAELMIRATKDTHHCFLEIAQVDASDTERLAAIDDGLVLDIIFLMGS